jgi:beta-glucanase (GH16 family)
MAARGLWLMALALVAVGCPSFDGFDQGGDAGRNDTADSGTPVAPPQVPTGWKLALDDEFDGDTLGPNWSKGTNLGTFVFSGSTYWEPYIADEGDYGSDSLVKVQNSNLILSLMAAPSPITGPNYGAKSYISGYANTFDKFAFKYGYMEFRIDLPEVADGADTGIWPVLALYNSTYSNDDQIDILESFGQDQTKVQITVPPNNTATSAVTHGYHVVGLLHQPTTIAFYVDDQLVQSFNRTMSSDMATLMGMKATSAAIHGMPQPAPANWPGGINGPRTADLKIDWVHVWTP